MKKILASVILLALGAAAMLSAPPVPPAMIVAGTTTTVTTNAISAPFGFFPTALVYAPSTVLKPSFATMLQWQPLPDPALDSYGFYYGDITTNAFPKIALPKTVNSVVFLNLNTNIVYGFYVTAINAAMEESKPSPLVILKPGTLSP